MQAGVWMSYSGSLYFSDKLLYKILFILSYQSKDMNFARLEQILQFSAKQRREKLFSPRQC
jgi:hypothetical protein